MTERTHSIVKDGKRLIWLTSQLWVLSRDLPVFQYRIADFTGLDTDCWYGHVNVPTIRSVLEHMARIESADLSCPIILSADGTVMDGVHRICKARLHGVHTLPAVQFMENPPPAMAEDYQANAPPQSPGAVMLSGSR